jgi:hypothetical protein
MLVDYDDGVIDHDYDVYEGYISSWSWCSVTGPVLLMITFTLFLLLVCLRLGWH